MAVTDSAGTVINRYKYDPYGMLIVSGTTEQVTQSYRYAGAYRDTLTGHYKMGARYYDSVLGRFTQRDQEPASAYSPRDYNRYVYVAADPINFTDPTGYARWNDPYTGSRGRSRIPQVWGVTRPAYRSTDYFGGRHNYYLWGRTGRLSNSQVVSYWSVNAVTWGTGASLLSTVPHPVALVGSRVGYGVAAAYGFGAALYPRTGWGWRYGRTWWGWGWEGPQW